ncbi:MAG: YdaS family helix-turn-helix protein [Pseudomonadota bacterium]|nr:YdaS family helix-turn-helix protein [Pseudomonadota bacterium]
MDLKTYISSQRGRAKQLAAQLKNVSPSYLSQMASGKAAISSTRCVEIELATNGQVSRRDLKPDDWQEHWPELAEQSP